jgi:hypothetical protein
LCRTPDAVNGLLHDWELWGNRRQIILRSLHGIARSAAIYCIRGGMSELNSVHRQSMVEQTITP